jgi:two-component system response regulator AtoC
MRVLIVDDEKNIRESLRKYLSLESIEALCAENAEAALALLEEASFDALVTDLKLPGTSGQSLLEAVQKKGFSVPVIMISAHGQIEDAVKALKAGAVDYLVKPFDPAELVIKLRLLVENRRRKNLLETETRSRRLFAGNRADGLPGMPGMIGESEVMRRLSAGIDKLASSGVTVLITGESGTGKEVAAREIHARGPARAEPFAAVNIGGIHETLMESELFGHEKGSFTGAAGRRQGLFELAGRGMIFLDEIGEMPMPLQVKLLRVVQERKIRRLGGDTDIPVNARIVSATNRDIEALVREGRFREDLYYRLNVFRLHMPPLRERRGDIPLLAAWLLDKLCSRMGRRPPALGGAALDKLLAWDFPGNVRELENILERALIFCESREIGERDIDIHAFSGLSAPPVSVAPAGTSLPVEASHTPPVPGTAAPPETHPVFPRLLEDIEKNAILAALKRCGGSHTKAAEELGITRKTIHNKLKSYGIE